MGIVGNAAVKTAHNARDSQRFFGVGDDKDVVVEVVRRVVERGDSFAFFRATDDNAMTCDFFVIEGVHRLTEFDKNIVCDIDDVIDRFDADRAKSVLNDFGTFANFDVFDGFCHITRAKVCVGNLNVQQIKDTFRRCGVTCDGRFHGFVKDCADFTRDTPYTVAVGTVCRDRNVQNDVGAAENFVDVDADFRVGFQNKNAVDVRAFVIGVGQTEFTAAAKHSERFHAAKFPVENTFSVGKNRAVKRDGNDIADLHVLRAGNDLQSCGFDVDLANPEVVGIGVAFHCEHASRNDVFDCVRFADNFFDLKTRVYEFVRKRFGRYIYFNKIL